MGAARASFNVTTSGERLLVPLSDPIVRGRRQFRRHRRASGRELGATRRESANVEVGHVPDGCSLDANNGESSKVHDVTIIANGGTVDTWTYAKAIGTNVRMVRDAGGLFIPTAVALTVTDVGLETAVQAA